LAKDNKDLIQKNCLYVLKYISNSVYLFELNCVSRFAAASKSSADDII